MKKLGRLTAIGLLIGTTAAMAQTTVVDADADGVFSLEELVVAYPDLTDELFAEIDVDVSGSIDADELQAAREQGLIDA